MSVYPETPLLGEGNLTTPTSFSPCLLTAMTEMWQSPPQTLQERLHIQSVPVQETKCSNKEKTHTFSGWQQQVSTRLRTGQDTSAEIPERIWWNMLWRSHLSCRSAFPNYCTICSDFPLQVHNWKSTKLRKNFPKSKGTVGSKERRKLELTLSWTIWGRRQWRCGKWAPLTGMKSSAVPPPATQHPAFLPVGT